MRYTMLLLIILLFSSTAQALTLPDFGWRYFVGSTAQLTKIRAAMREMQCAEYGPELTYCTYYNGSPIACEVRPNPFCGTNVDELGQPANVVEPPWGMGDVDCMHAHWADDPQITSKLGQSYLLNGELIEIPTYEDLATQETWPGECYGYQFALQCGDDGMGWLICMDP